MSNLLVIIAPWFGSFKLQLTQHAIAVKSTMAASFVAYLPDGPKNQSGGGKTAAWSLWNESFGWFNSPDTDKISWHATPGKEKVRLTYGLFVVDLALDWIHSSLFKWRYRLIEHLTSCKERWDPFYAQQIEIHLGCFRTRWAIIVDANCAVLQWADKSNGTTLPYLWRQPTVNNLQSCQHHATTALKLSR